MFINFCQSEHIKTFSKQKKLDEDGEEQEGIHVPLSLGPPHEVVDHAKKTCIAVDVAVNPQVIKDCDSDKTGTFRNFCCELAIQYVEEKYKFQVDPQYKLPRLTYRGSLPPPKHYIRKTQTPTIEEVVSDAASSSLSIQRPPTVELSPLCAIVEESWNDLDTDCSDETSWQVTDRISASEGGSALCPSILQAAPQRLRCKVALTPPVCPTQ